MSNPLETPAQGTAPAQAEIASSKTAPARAPAILGFSIGGESIIKLIFALIGAGMVFLAAEVLLRVAVLFSAATPYIAGGILFATIVSIFFALLNSRKMMFRNVKFRISFAEGYTAVAIFIIMGYFATACMHAFLGDGLALGLWNQGVSVCAMALVGFGMGKFAVSLWHNGAKKS